MVKIKVLLFAANPRGTDPLDLHREFREMIRKFVLGNSAMPWNLPSYREPG